MEVDPTHMCEPLVGLPDVVVLGVVDDGEGVPLRVYVEMRNGSRACAGCAGPSGVNERPEVELVDLPVFGRQARLVGRKHRLVCRQADCAVVSWTVENPAIAAPRLALTDRAGRWVTRAGRPVRADGERGGNRARLRLAHRQRRSDRLRQRACRQPGEDRPADGLGAGRDAVLPAGAMAAPVLMSTSIVDVSSGRLLDVVAGRSAAEPAFGWPPGRSPGARPFSGRPRTCRVPIGRCSTRCCPTPPRSPIRSIS